MKNEKIKLVVYLRISTIEQEKSGLGLLVQEQEINHKIISLKANSNEITVLGTFKDIASGKSRNNRNGLEKALKMCKEKEAYLIFQKLDRLSRNIQDGITIFKEINEKMIIAQWGQVDSLYFNLRLCIADEERKLISERTKKALNELKKQGVKLGRKWKRDNKGKIIVGQNSKAIKVMLEIRRNNSKKHYEKINIIITDYRKQKYSYLKIANKLNQLNYRTIKNNKFGIHTIQKLINQYKLFSN